MPLDVDAAPPGPAGELGVLPRRQVGVGLAVPLVQPLDDHGPGRHVDAQRQGLGGEHGADQPGREQLLDHLLEGGQQPGVVRGDAPAQPGQPRS